MDARPQRPTRATRTGQDENTAPDSQKFNHNRNKSVGATANMAPNALKAPAKRTAFGERTAFGDLSNINRLSTIIAQNEAKKTIEVNKTTLVEKPSALLKPAQRAPIDLANKPVASNTHKHALSESISASIATKIALVESKPLAPPPKRALIRRATTIWNDTEANASQAVKQEGGISASQPIVGPRHHKSQPQLKHEQPVERQTETNAIAAQVNDYASASKFTAAPATSVYEDAQEQQVVTYSPKTEFVEPTHQHVAVDLHRPLPPTPLLQECEEYFEEDDEDHYDDLGYSTAHSYSHGDNTTGGATTILMPKITNKVRKEISEAKQIVEQARTLEDIEDDAWDTSMVAEYGDEIFSYMRELEQRMLPNAHYMEIQSEIQWSMRSVLMDWLVQVHGRFQLLPETLFLCVNYIDRFLSCKVVSLGKLQLVGATALFVAAKYEEINCPAIGEIVYMVDGGYSTDEILKAERFMLSMLSFELGWPGPMSFLRRISKADDYDLETRTLAKYFLEVTIMDERFVGSPPSYIAAGAHCFARLMLRKGDWSPAHVYYSGYTWTQLRPLVSMMMQCCEYPDKHHSAVFEKYSDRRFKRASLFVQGEIHKGFALPMPTSVRRSLPSIEDVAAYMPHEAANWTHVRA